MASYEDMRRDQDFRFPSRLPNVDHRYIEDRMGASEYARNLARDLWFALRMAILEGHADVAARSARRLVYLCTHYATDTLADPHQGMRTHANQTHADTDR